MVLLVSPALLLGQLGYNTVTVTTPAAGSLADQAVFVVSVQGGVDKTLDTVVGALAGTGITAANLAGFSAQVGTFTLIPVQPATNLTWIFQLTVPAAKTKDTITTLTGLEKTLQQNQNGLSLSFSLSGRQASAAAACNPADLIASAQKQAQTIASAAGLNAGAIRAITSATVSGVPVCSLTARFALGLLFGQTDPHAIAITASKSTSPQPDQILIALTVTSRLTPSQDDVAAALSQAGITGATFNGVSSTSVGVLPIGVGTAVQPTLQWSSTLTAPIAKANDTVALLVAAQQTLAKSEASLNLTFYTQGLQVSPALEAAQTCTQSDLVSDANAAAQKLAAAAGVSVGPILSLGSGGTGGVATAVFAGLSLSPGPFGTLLGIPPATNCSLTVQYQMLPCYR
jgi:hypothetical protein